MKEIEIMCFYYSYVGREVSYYEICNGTDLMDESDYASNNFWFSLGGFSITVDGFKTIFKSHDFYNMTKATSFLLNTLYWLDNKYSNWFNDYKNAEEISIEFGLNEKLTIRNCDIQKIALSYSHQNATHQKKRGDRFFESVILDKQEWVGAVKAGLSEYFEILLKVAQSNQNDSTSKTMMEYYNIWKGVA
jgi:hypothetical protein